MAMYEVPSGSRRLPVEHLLDDVPSVTLTPDLDVLVDGEVVGSVEDAELRQLAEAGLTPVVAAERGALLVPPAGQVLPVNRPPRAPWALLPAGARYPAELSEPLSVEAPAQVLVSLGFDDAGEVVLCVDGEVVGELDPAAGEALTPSLRRLEERDLIAVARGYTTATDGKTALTVNAGPIDAEETPAISPLPPIVREVDVAPATSSFFATVDAEAAALAADTQEPPAETTRGAGKSRAPLFATAAAITALVLAGAGAVVMSTPSGLERDMTSVYETTTNQVSQPSSSAAEATETPVRTEPSEESEAPAQAPAPQEEAYEYSIGGLKLRSNTRLDQPLYEAAEP